VIRGSATLLVRPDAQGQHTLTPEQAGWAYVGFLVRRVAPQQPFSFGTGGSEAAIVVLGGVVDVRSSVGEWPAVGRRRDVFDGLPFGLYLPPGTDVEVSSAEGAEIAVGLARSDQTLPPRLIRPEEVAVELRGQGNASRNIYHVIPPEFPAHRLLVVEVLTPPGHWSSYPPHKHDEDRPPQEVDLEEIYYHRQEPGQGFAVQRVYTDDRDLDETLTVGDGDLVLVPRGYHVVAQAYGYRGYYLNVLAGERRSMAGTDDAAHAWIRKSWTEGMAP
jgi:5-deoxy-glucuronate isomerase